MLTITVIFKKQQIRLYLKNLLTIFISITFILFILSAIILYTTWLDDYFLVYKEQLEFRAIIGYVKFYTSLILIFFLIAQANYMIKLNRNIKRKKLQLDFGIIFGTLLILKIVGFYYISIPIIELTNNSHYYGGTEAKKNIMNVKMAYINHGVISEYYDENNTKQRYKPSVKDIQRKKESDILEKDRKVFIKLFHEAPLNIVIAFLTLIGAFYFSSRLARQKLKNISVSKHT